MRIQSIILIVAMLCFATGDSFAQKKPKKDKKKKPLVEVNINTNRETEAPKRTEETKLQPVEVNSDIATVEAKGVGVKREDALQDALRNAVGQAVGVSVSSETRVENFVVIQDAVSSRAQGYVSKYDVIKETPFPDRYEIIVRADVSLSPLKADINLLARSVGGIRFLVMYDSRNVSADEELMYDFAVERINERLSEKGYRYIEKRRFDELKKEARNIGHEIAPSEEKYIQRLGMMSDAQFIIFISKIHTTSRSVNFDTQTSTKFTIEVKAYDNCTAEGLGTISIESDWATAREKQAGIFAGVQDAVSNNFDRLLSVFARYIGSWVNNGTPYELRFYQVGTYRDFRSLRAKLQDDPNFGGEMEIVSVDNYTKLNLTFKNRPDQLADKILDMADDIPDMKAKVLDIKFLYGRQINFAPQNVKLPEFEGIKQ